MHYTFFTTKPDSPARAIIEEFQRTAREQGAAAAAVREQAFPEPASVRIMYTADSVIGFVTDNLDRTAAAAPGMWLIKGSGREGLRRLVPTLDHPQYAAFAAIPKRMTGEELCTKLFGVSRFFVGRETCSCSLEYNEDNSIHSIGVPWWSSERKTDGLSQTAKVKLARGLVRFNYDKAMRIHYAAVLK